MNILLTGGTGFVGSAVLRQLLEHGHTVTALVRSQQSAEAVTAAGASAVIGDLTDTDWLGEQLSATDAAIHTASPGDASSAEVDTAVARAVTAAYAGTGKSYLHTSGVWVWGNGADITEDQPFHAPALTAWRADVEQIVLDGDGFRAVIVAPAVVYGHGQGLPTLLSGAPTDADGSLRLIGDGSQHWTTVHVDDLADLYVRAVESPDASGYFIGADGTNPTVLELGAAAGDGRVRTETADESRDRLGGPLADALMLDQQATAAKAREQLGWSPSRPSLVTEFREGSYRS